VILGPLLDAALIAQEACQSAGLRGCIIGGLALQRWGEPRYTADVDLSVLVEAGQEAAVTRVLLERLEPRIADAAAFAVRSHVILARTRNGVGIDIALAGLPYEVRVVERSSDWELDPGVFLRTCSAEDLLVMKTFAGRDKDWADVTSILERRGTKLDLDLVRRELAPLLAAKGTPELARELERRITRHVVG
jgi:hypothetical protein